MTKQLHIKINIKENTYLFLGDTFLHKEKIKSLGAALWDSKQKVWVVRNPSIKKNELVEFFPGAVILEEDFAQSKVSDQAELELIKPDLVNDSSLEKDALSVSGLLSSVKLVINKSFSNVILVYGVLSSVKKITSGRVYFDLIDSKENSSVRCVVWENNNSFLKVLSLSGIELEDNTPIMIKSRVSFNLKAGQVSLYVEGFVPEYTLGKFQANREITNEKLKKEGLFYNNKNTKMPFLPIRLGVLTSDAGTVINDFKASLSVCGFGFKLFWYHVRVQGEYAENDIIKGIQYFQSNHDVDLILIFRGGGSVTELSVFNNYKIAKAICCSKKPILSAIGHEYDQSSTQDVSFLSFGVPKDIGRYLSDIILDKKNILLDLGKNISFNSKKALSSCEKDLGAIIYKAHRAMLKIFDLKNASLKNKCLEIQKLTKARVIKSNQLLATNFSLLRKQLFRVYDSAFFRVLKFSSLIVSANTLFENYSTKLNYLDEHIKSNSPEIQLRRGFAIIRNVKTDLPMMRSEDFKNENSVIIEMIDGQINAIINNG